MGSCLALALFAGCSSFPMGKSHSAKSSAFVPANHAGDASLPAGLRRVVLLPVAGGNVAPAESVAELDPVFTAALQRQNRFEVVALSRVDCVRYFQAEELSSVSALPAGFMAVIRHEFAADAVVLVDVTVFQPYDPLVLGLRAKLATVDGVRLVWTFDNVFSADNPAVAESARRQAAASDRDGMPADTSPVVLQSPARFAAYAAAAMFDTLPPVKAPVVPATSVAATSR
jgi:hypothetical protein